MVLWLFCGMGCMGLALDDVALLQDGSLTNITIAKEL